MIDLCSTSQEKFCSFSLWKTSLYLKRIKRKKERKKKIIFFFPKSSKEDDGLKQMQTVCSYIRLLGTLLVLAFVICPCPTLYNSIHCEQKHEIPE